MWKYSFLLLFFPLIFLYPYQVRFIEPQKLVLAQLELAQEIHKRFHEGPLKNTSLCFKEVFHDHFYQCHLETLLCSLNHDLGYSQKLIFQNIEFEFKKSDFISSSSHDFSGRPSYVLTFSYKNYEFDLILEKNCHESLLKEDIYSFQTSDQVLLWDNYGRKIYANSYLIRNKEINEWAKIHSQFSHLRRSPEISIADHLNENERRAFCAFYHGEVFSAHYFDAFTFLSRLPSKYPWAEFLQSGDLCHLRYTKECSKHKFHEYYPYSPTRFHLYESLGPYKEYLENFYENLHWQSFHKDLSFEDEKFQLNNRTSFEDKGGFRCVYSL